MYTLVQANNTSTVRSPKQPKGNWKFCCDCVISMLKSGEMWIQCFIVDLEIFVVKIFSWFVQTMKINKKNAKYSLQRIFIIARTFLSISQHSYVTSYYTWDSLFFITSSSLELMANTWQLFTQCLLNHLSLLPQYVPTALFSSLLHTSNSPTAEW